MPNDLSQIPNFGLYHLSLDEAGMLIAKCLWFRGEVECSFLLTDGVAFNDCELTAALNSQAIKFTRLLVNAVIKGHLTPKQTGYDLTNKVQPAETYVEAFYLAGWLEERGLALGTVFEDEYLTKENELAERLSYLVRSERFAVKRPEVTSTIPEMLFLRHELAKQELAIAELKRNQLGPIVTSERQQSAYLNIIGALLALLLGKSAGGVPYSKFKTQQAIIDAIHGMVGELPGLSVRNLQDKFAKAKQSLAHR